MPVIAQTADGRKIVQASTAGPASYTTGGFTITVGELSRITAVVSASITGGYAVEVAGVSGNTVTVKVYHYDYPAAAAGPAVEVAAGTNLSTSTVTLTVIGY